MQKYLSQLDVPLSNVVRTRMLVTDISRWQEFGKAQSEFFAGHPPTIFMVAVKIRIDPEVLIEVEADTYVAERD